MISVRFVLTASAMFAAAPALAQDAGDFSGARAEATIGLDQLRFDLAQVGSDGRAKQSDLGYGIAIGYDAAVAPRLVAGIEAGMNFADTGYSIGSATDGSELRRRREIVLAGRLGTPVTENALLYGKLGYANLQVRTAETVAGTTTGRTDELDGVQLGAGVEVKLSPQAYWKSEYRYTDYAKGYTSNNIVTGIGVRF